MEERLKIQVISNARKAFCDSISEKLNKNPPDYEFLKTLYDEIKIRLCGLTPNRKDRHKLINDKMDSEIFLQCIKNNAFNMNDMYDLITYCFGIIKELEAPIRNRKTDEIVIQFKKDTKTKTLISIIPDFILQLNLKIDEIENDINVFKSKYRK
jgi:hypothetical protein